MNFSIIIPTLNEEKLLPGILHQIRANNILETYNAEIIISDGGSTDNTLTIAKQFTNKIIVHKSSKKQNIAGGRNQGAKLANSNILIFLGADVLFPDIIEFFNYLNNEFINSKYLAMTCNVKISPEEEILSDRLFHFLINNYFYLLNVTGVGMGRGECLVIRNEVFKKHNGFKENLAAGEDFDLFRRIRKSGKILYARSLYIYESPRRYRKIGYLNVYKSWFINSYYVIFKNKSMAEEWEQVR